MQVVEIPVEAMGRASEVDCPENVSVVFDRLSRTISVRVGDVVEVARLYFRLTLRRSEEVRATMVPTPVLVIPSISFEMMVSDSGHSALSDWLEAVRIAISIFDSLEEATRGLRADEDDF